MRRTELIPQTSAAINEGTVYYHFSMQRLATDAPSEFREHQIAFFESHFTEMKAGWISGESATSDAALIWDVSSTTQWNTTWEAGVWHNIAYEIDFDAGSVAFYHSTGADDLALTVPAVSVSASSNGADWHLGVLELPRDGYTDSTEDIYFSGVYVESGDLTTSVSGPSTSNDSGSISSDTSVAVVSTVANTSSAPSSATTPAALSGNATTTSPVVTTTFPTIIVSMSPASTFSTVVVSSSVSATPSGSLADEDCDW